MTTDDGMPPEPEIVTVTVTCHTDGCENADQSLDVPVVLPDPVVMCGVCGQVITDVDGLPPEAAPKERERREAP